MARKAPRIGSPTEAPFRADLAQGPQGGRAYWVHSDDGVRLRVGFWLGPERGTVFIFPGRTEYVEKYGPLANDLASLGFSALAIDWRGQGLADRLIQDARVGHVHRFCDYQSDVAAVIELARQQGAPEPYYLIGHSMGGGIALRTLLERSEFKAVTFSGPMWGIRLNPVTRHFARPYAAALAILGLANGFAPSTTAINYALTAPFEGNMLTTDESMWDFMVLQMREMPEVALAGPSTHWVHEALKECDFLFEQPSPSLPCLTILGGSERIVEKSRVYDRMERWPGGQLIVPDGAEHEVLMETPEIRARILAALDTTFR